MVALNILRIGTLTLDFMKYLGNISLFAANILYCCFRPPFYFKQFFKELYKIGFLSLPVVGLTAVFTGMVLALQSYTGFSRFSAENSIATVVVLSITRELGPVLASLMVAGRVGAAMAAEIGTMRVTEQIDALITLSTNPMKYLVVPKVLASIISLPLLVICADAIGVLGGYLISVHKLKFNGALYLEQTFKYLEAHDVNSGLVKAAVFGFIISLFGCYQGYKSKGGAQGVGFATTNAVVLASITILISDYILTALLFAK
ncbi:MAG: ABC transporter permease [Alphaproteobacteria bacterium]